VAEFIVISVMNLVTPNAVVIHELLLNKVLLHFGRVWPYPHTLKRLTRPARDKYTS
jgi:hypothetical protein